MTSRSGKVYQVRSMTNLSLPFGAFSDIPAGFSSATSFTNALTAAVSFYRVEFLQ